MLCHYCQQEPIQRGSKKRRQSCYEQKLRGLPIRVWSSLGTRLKLAMLLLSDEHDTRVLRMYEVFGGYRKRIGSRVYVKMGERKARERWIWDWVTAPALREMPFEEYARAVAVAAQEAP